MLNITDRDNSIDFVLTSEKDIANRVIDAGKSFLLRHDITRVTTVEMCLQELLGNALLHGNQNIPDKLIYCSIEILPGRRIKVIVEDQGPGIHSEEIITRRQRLHNSLNENSYVTQCISNEKNNRATVFIDARPLTTFGVVMDCNQVIITPSGNVTAATGDQLKEVLQDILKKQPRDLLFNFRNVDEIDSVALSLLIVFAKQVATQCKEYSLKITEANSDLRALFALTRVEEMYTVMDSAIPKTA